jgi:hypothetical protein
MSGIHDAAYQAQLNPTAAALTKRSFDWHAQLRMNTIKEARGCSREAL